MKCNPLLVTFVLLAIIFQVPPAFAKGGNGAAFTIKGVASHVRNRGNAEFVTFEFSGILTLENCKNNNCTQLQFSELKNVSITASMTHPFFVGGDSTKWLVGILQQCSEKGSTFEADLVNPRLSFMSGEVVGIEAQVRHLDDPSKGKVPCTG